MGKKKTVREVMLDIYRELYRKATPSADFDELVANAKVNEYGTKDIPYMDYYLDDDEYVKTVNKYLKRYSRRDSGFLKAIEFEAYLGCGPTSHKPDSGETVQET